MKCYRVALLLALVLASRTAGVLAAENGTTVIGEQTVVLPLGLEMFRQAVPFQSPACLPGDGPAANGASLYDLYYANALNWNHPEENAQDQDDEQINGDDRTHEENAGADEELGIEARMACTFQHGLSWLAASGQTAARHASHCWEQVVTFVRDFGSNHEEFAMDSDNALDDFAETADETCPAETKQGADHKPERRGPVEYLYVDSCPKYGNAAFLDTWDESATAWPVWRPRQSVVFGEFYWEDEESCPAPATAANSADQRPSPVGDVDGDEMDDEPTPATLTVRLQQWTQWSVDKWNVAFRNISQQIAWLDWTLLFEGQPTDQAARNAAPASDSLDR